MRMERDIWSYPGGVTTSSDLTGFSVEALDGGIGKVDDATSESGGSFLIVDTGIWIFGKKVMLPAGLIDNVDLDAQTVYVNRTKDQIKNAPKFEQSRLSDPAYRTDLGHYYGEGGGYGEPQGERGLDSRPVDTERDQPL
jgi:hypothetical protein